MPGSAIFDASLVDELQPDVDDILTDVLPDVGIRQYRMHRVARTWPSGTPGKGSPVDSVVEFTPIPKILDWHSSLTIKLHACGQMEEGDIIALISRSYTEAEIGYGTEGSMLRVSEGHGQLSRTRNFVHAHAPFKRTFVWACHLRLLGGVK